MERIVATVKGQVVIPVRLRRKLGIKKGTRFAVEEENGSVILIPINRDYYRRFAGILKGGPDLYKELKEERKQEEEARDRKFEAPEKRR